MKNIKGIIDYTNHEECKALTKTGSRCKFPVFYRGSKYCLLHFIAREEDEDEKTNAIVADVACNDATCNSL